MPPSFDLADRGFCRVRWRPGGNPSQVKATRPLSLRELFIHAHEIADVQVPHPPALSGLLRVLYVLAARVTGLDHLDDALEWEDTRESLLDRGKFDAESVQRYFAGQRGRFELFHTATDFPFLQDKRLLEQCRTTKGETTSSGVNKLVLGRAAGQGFVWQSHTVDQDALPVPAEQAVFALLTWLYYGVPGRCTPRRVGATSAADTKGGPLRGTVSFHPVGKSLFETLLLGIPYLPTAGEDTATWEEEPGDPLGVPPLPQGIGRVLTGRFRHAVLLTPSESGESVVDARITWAWRNPQGPVNDPYLIHRESKQAGQSPYPEAASADRAVWRDLDALLGKHEQRHRPAVFAGLDDLMVTAGRAVRIKALGFDQDRSQAKDRQYYAASTPAVLELWQRTSPQRWKRLRDARVAAEERADHLRGALTGAWRELTRGIASGRSRDGGVPWLHPAMTRYWTAAEDTFWAAVASADPPADGVVNRFIRCAASAYDHATRAAARNLREIEVVERHRRRLWKGWQTQHPSQDGTEDD